MRLFADSHDNDGCGSITAMSNETAMTVMG